MVTIYILELASGKYYVGKTNNIDIRLNTHFYSNGSFWTMKYKPVKIKAIYKNCCVFDEDKYTLKMMAKYGVNNVRGGTFTRIILQQDELNIINKMIEGANDICFNCYSVGHFIKECPYDEINNYSLVTMRNEIINRCKITDSLNTNYIHIDILSKILLDIEPIIFNNLLGTHLHKLCKLVNKISISGIGDINIANNMINYIDFSIGITVLLDKQLDFLKNI